MLRDDMRQPLFEAIDELEFPELYDETIPVLSFFRYLRKLMGAAGYQDLSMRVSDSEHDSALAYRACNTAMLRERQGTGAGKPHSLRPCRVAYMLVTRHLWTKRTWISARAFHVAVSCRT
jgi:Nuf2 family